MKVELTREDVQEALASFAAKKAGVTCSFLHKVNICGSWVCLDENPVEVEITPMPNVVKLEPA